MDRSIHPSIHQSVAELDSASSALFSAAAAAASAVGINSQVFPTGKGQFAGEAALQIEIPGQTAVRFTIEADDPPSPFIQMVGHSGRRAIRIYRCIFLSFVRSFVRSFVPSFDTQRERESGPAKRTAAARSIDRSIIPSLSLSDSLPPF